MYSTNTNKPTYLHRKPVFEYIVPVMNGVTKESGQMATLGGLKPSAHLTKHTELCYSFSLTPWSQEHFYVSTKEGKCTQFSCCELNTSIQKENTLLIKVFYFIFLVFFQTDLVVKNFSSLMDTVPQIMSSCQKVSSSVTLGPQIPSPTIPRNVFLSHLRTLIDNKFTAITHTDNIQIRPRPLNCYGLLFLPKP